VYLAMAHLGADAVRRQFKGMVDRCADCGFDLAGGRVEVVPTAHYMMGGVEFAPDCTTELPGLFVAGEDSGGVHGANRLGGNGVANSTVFGGIAGDTIARWLRGERGWREPVAADLAAAVARAEAPLRGGSGARPARGIEDLREALYTTMWDDAGIVRDAPGLARAADTLARIADELRSFAVADGNRDRAFNLAWHDALNLANLTAVSQVIVRAAQSRCNSRGAHYRADFPDPGDLATSTYTQARAAPDGAIAVARRPVRFTRVRPGASLIAST
jgi:fumarate reductase flavoprotein subunit